MLSNGVSILDSVTYYTQLSDVTFGRYPNGTGSFGYLVPTFGYENNNWAVSVASLNNPTQFTMYPNPANNSINLLFNGTQEIEIFSILGQQIFSAKAEDRLEINTADFTNGVYFVKCGNTSNKLIINH